jgi:hypothetical protein
MELVWNMVKYNFTLFVKELTNSYFVPVKATVQ